MRCRSAKSVEMRQLVAAPPTLSRARRRVVILRCEARWLLPLARLRDHYECAVKIATRLAVIMLICMIPVLAAYTYFGIRQATHTYVGDLKRETRATARAGRRARPGYRTRQWEDVRLALERTQEEDVAAAIFGIDGEVMRALRGFPLEPPPEPASLTPALDGGGVEFMQTEGDRDWFCRAVALRIRAGAPIGILLVAQRWNDVENDLRARVAQAVLASLAMAALIALLIPFVSHCYVARPLADLSAKVARISSVDSRDTLGNRPDHADRADAAGPGRAPRSAERLPIIETGVVGVEMSHPDILSEYPPDIDFTLKPLAARAKPGAAASPSANIAILESIPCLILINLLHIWRSASKCARPKLPEWFRRESANAT